MCFGPMLMHPAYTCSAKVLTESTSWPIGIHTNSTHLELTLTNRPKFDIHISQVLFSCLWAGSFKKNNLAILLKLASFMYLLH